MLILIMNHNLIISCYPKDHDVIDHIIQSYIRTSIFQSRSPTNDTEVNNDHWLHDLLIQSGSEGRKRNWEFFQLNSSLIESVSSVSLIHSMEWNVSMAISGHHYYHYYRYISSIYNDGHKRRMKTSDQDRDGWWWFDGHTKSVKFR